MASLVHEYIASQDSLYLTHAVVYFLPLFTFTLFILFSITLYFHWKRKKEKSYLLWWLIGILTFGAGTLTESFNTLFGWHELNFRWWYVTGALLGGAPLAQGTVYLLMKRILLTFSVSFCSS